MGHGILVLVPFSHFWGVRAERRESNCFCTTSHPPGTLPEGAVGFASSYGASEKMLPVGQHLVLLLKPAFGEKWDSWVP